MRTTITIDPALFKTVKNLSIQNEQTLSSTIIQLLRRGIHGSGRSKRSHSKRLRWHSRNMRPLINYDDKEALYSVLDGKK
jgi:hypothetical protein